MGSKGGSAQVPQPINTGKLIHQENLATKINQITPGGNVNWTQLPNGRWVEKTTLSQGQQKLLNQGQGVASGALNDLNQHPANLTTNVNAPNLQTSVNNPGVPVTSLGNAGQIATGTGFSGAINPYGYQAGAIDHKLDNSGPINKYGYQAGGIQHNVANAGDLQSNVNGAPIQGQLNTAGLSGIPKADHDAYEQAVNSVYGQATSRLDPQWQQDQTRLETQLANQGVAQNSDAWNKAMMQFTQGKNDAYNSAFNNAVTQGQSVESALFNMGLSANQAGMSNALASGNFANAAQGQGFAQGLSNAGLANAAQGQKYGQNLSDLQAANQAQQQKYSQGLANIQQQNAAQQQQYNQNLGEGQFENQAQQQKYNQGIGNLQQQLQAQGQKYGENLSNAQLQNQGQNQQYQQNLGSANFANSAAGQQLAQELATAGFGNSAMQQMFANGMQNAGLNNSAEGQRIQTDLAQTGLPSQYLNLNQPSTGQPADVLGAYSLNAQQQMANYQNQTAQNSAKKGGMGSLLGTLGSAGILASDRRVKRDIRRVGHAPNGLPIYSFRYAWDKKHQLGLMAQDVEKIAPHAVVSSGGIKHVDYGKALAA